MRRTLVGVDQALAIEHERGVDISQIRQLLRMTVAERVAEMVRVSSMVLDAQAHVQAHVGRPPIRLPG
jgi:hypothetical protein